MTGSRLITAFALASIALVDAGCGGSSDASFVEYRVVNANGGTLTANVGTRFVSRWSRDSPMGPRERSPPKPQSPGRGLPR